MGPALSAQYAAVFDRPWPVWAAAVLVATPWLYSGSLVNLGVLLGGLTAALLAREFAIRIPPGGEFVKGAGGGLLMGTGAILAFGCNLGGFFSAVSALSLSGFGMMVGLGLGAYLGLRYLLWETERRPQWSGGRARGWGAARGAGPSRQPLAGLVLGLALLALPFAYARLGFHTQGVFGAGMTLAGGCGAGSIWRAGEGQVKLWLALGGFALGAALTRLALAPAGVLQKLGWAVFLPSVIGWGGALVGSLAVLAAWALLPTWNEDARVFTAPD